MLASATSDTSSPVRRRKTWEHLTRLTLFEKKLKGGFFLLKSVRRVRCSHVLQRLTVEDVSDVADVVVVLLLFLLVIVVIVGVCSCDAGSKLFFSA